MLDEPSLSRQWVARRLQRALTVERWGGPARCGLARVGGETGQLLSGHGDSSRTRAAALEELIREVGSEPYPSWGIGAPTTKFAAAVLGSTSGYLSKRLAHIIAEYTLSEYRALGAFVEDALGVPADLGTHVAPLYEQSSREFESLASVHSRQ